MIEYLILAILATVVLTSGLTFVLAKLFFSVAIRESVSGAIKHPFELQRQEYQHQLELQKQDLQNQFEKQLNSLERKDKYQLAALEQRLSIHQQAYALSFSLSRTLRSEDDIREKTNFKCREFWEKNCLYLSNEARKAFRKALVMHYYFEGDKERGIQENSETTTARIRQTEEILEMLPKILAEAVDLEAFSNEGQDLSAINERALLSKSQELT